MHNHLSVGLIGEDAACDYLASHGYSILERNSRTKFGEIDIVASAPDKTLVVVEVKTLTRAGDLSPEDNLTRSKFFKLSRMAQFYANAHPELVDDSAGWRIDLISIILDPNPIDSPAIRIGKNNVVARHYKNISG